MGALFGMTSVQVSLPHSTRHNRLQRLRLQVLRGEHMSVLGKPVVRAAVYTRKSSDEGLDQEFNSLDAQHEACSAYIASQRHEGWKLIKKRFDDGGISGGTLERPALQSLLSDVDQRGLIDMIVVYKIDRLTRSLSDFAKLIDRLEAKGCSFVSVTQSFNTSSSMGRLTLIMLFIFLPSLSVKLLQSVFAIRSQPPRRRACGWEVWSPGVTRFTLIQRCNHSRYVKSGLQTYRSSLIFMNS